jgi:hypothetical protein
MQTFGAWLRANVIEAARTDDQNATLNGSTERMWRTTSKRIARQVPPPALRL